VKGPIAGADTVTVTKNEILNGLNKPEEFILALVEVDGDSTTPRYVPFGKQLDFAAASVNYRLVELIARGDQPR
jgi:hypothetical protein